MEGTHDPSPDTYKLWRIFTVPDETKAVAMKMNHANLFIALYTSIITASFVTTWSILISLIILLAAPKRMTRTTYIAIISTWACNDPYTACILMVRHSWRVGCGIVKKSHPVEFTWKALWFDVVVLFFALGTVAGSFVVALLSPEWLVVGTVAPVNPSMVYYPVYDSGGLAIDEERLMVQYDSMASMRAVGSIDATQGTMEKQGKVAIERIDLPPVNGEDRYELKYSYNVNGTEMGLQKLSELQVHVSGSCKFMDDWYSKFIQAPDETTGELFLYEEYALWPPSVFTPNSTYQEDLAVEEWGVGNSRYVYPPVYRRTPPSAWFNSVQYIYDSRNWETGRSYYTIVPLTALGPALSASRDPWYATRDIVPTEPILRDKFPYEVNLGRPPLMCQQNDIWKQGDDWSGTLINLISNGTDGPPVAVPPGIRSILLPAFSYPMVVTLGISMNAAALKSATRLLQVDKAIDTQTASTHQDMSRLLSAAYIATRDMFRNAALAAATVKEDIADGTLPNALRNEDGTLMEGTGDFVISTSAVQALSLPALITIPVIFFVLVFIVTILRAGRKVGKPKNNTPGRLDRYLMLVTGLQATQLYRMVDQLLAERAPETPDGLWHQEQALWTDQTGELPFVADNKRASTVQRVVLPEFHVQIKEPLSASPTVPPEAITRDSDYRLILGVRSLAPESSRESGEKSGHPDHGNSDIPMWRSLSKSDKRVKIAKLDRQKHEETYHIESAWRRRSDLSTMSSGVPKEKMPPIAQVRETTDSAANTPEIEECKELR